MGANDQQRAWQRDAFLEQCLGYPVVRLRTISAWRQAMEHVDADAEWMIEARIPVDRIDDLGTLTARGFRVIDTNVQLERPAASVRARGDVACRFAASTDETSVRAIAATAFSQTRFHRDPRISAAAANRVKEEWAGNFFSGKRGEWMIVAEDDDGVAGFLQVLRATTSPDAIVIDLIAVAQRARGRGLAKAMIARAADECLGRPVAMFVGTQIANFTSLALYAGLGFRIVAAAHLLHMHQQDLQ